jgi:hypothetical protein
MSHLKYLLYLIGDVSASDQIQKIAIDLYRERIPGPL